MYTSHHHITGSSSGLKQQQLLRQSPPLHSPNDESMMISTRRRKRLLILFVLLTLILFTSSLINNFLSMFLEPLRTCVSTSRSKSDDGSIDIYIPGAGFSGFFYTLGRLQALHNSSHRNASTPNYHYYCFSAGCLALLTSLMQAPVGFAVELAHSSRNRWIMGEIGRYDVVQHFVDGLFLFSDEDKYASLDGKPNATMAEEKAECHSNQGHEIETTQLFELKRVGLDIRKYFPRINVITSTWDAKYLISQRIQKPISVKHFKELLIQTTWIPFVTGSSFWKRGGDVYHSDGAFAGLLHSFYPSLSKQEHLFHPRKYHHALLLPWNLDLLSNGLNILLGYDQAIYYWEEGYKRGVLTCL